MQKKFFTGKSSLFYKLFVLLVSFIVGPGIIALSISQKTITESSEQLRSVLSATLENQLLYMQSSSPARSNPARTKSMQENQPLMRLGQQTTISHSNDVFEVERFLLELQNRNTNSTGESTKYLYFIKSDYLMGSEVSGEDAREYAHPEIFSAIQDLLTLPTNSSRSWYGTEADGKNFFTINTTVVSPDIFHINVHTYTEDEGPTMFLSSSLIDALYGSELCYYDSYGNSHSATTKQELSQLFEFDTLGENKANSFSFREDGNTYMCFYVYNADNHTKIALFYQDKIADTQHMASMFLWITVGFALAVCVMLAIFLLQRTYSPIESLVNRIVKPKNEGIRDDIHILAEALDTMDYRLKAQDQLLQKCYLLRIIRGLSTEFIEDYRDKWLAAPENCAFAVAAVRIDAMQSGAELIEDELEQSTIKQFHLAGYDLLSVWDGDMHCLVFRFQNARRNCNHIAEVFLQLQEQLPNCSISAFISMIHPSCKELHICYSEVMSVAEYCMLLDKYGMVLCYEDIRDILNQQKQPALDFTQLHSLFNCVALLSVEESLALYDSIVYRLISGGNNLIKDDSAFSVLTNIIALALYDVSLPGDVGKAKAQYHVRLLRAAEDSTKLRELLHNSLQEFANYNDNQNFDRKNFDQIVLYLHKSYRDPNLSSAMVAKKFGTSQSNITRMFKKYNNTGFLEYVHKLRVTEANKLLLETDLVLSEIATIVGYTNTITMNRAFKIHAYSTPGVIRKNQSVMYNKE